MKTLFAGSLLLYCVTAGATGWLDYELDIGDGYSLFRANSFDVALARDGWFIVSHYDFNEIGPIVGYFKSPSHILLKASGWKPRNAFPDDDLKEIDHSKAFCFLVRIDDGRVEGPFPETTFLEHPTVMSLGEFEWIRPENPNFWLPLLGTLMFVSLSAPMLYAKYWYVTAPVTLLIVYGLIRWRRKKPGSGHSFH